MSEQDELLREFLIESYENLDRLDGEFVALEEDPSSKETLSSIFRTIHTIKGTCGFLNLSRLESVTHAGENLLSSLREGEIALNDEITTALLHLVDAVREMLACIEETGEEGAEEYLDLMATLKRLQALSPAPVAAAATGDGAPGEAAPSTEPEIDAEEPEGGALPMGGVAEEGDLVALEEVTGVLPSDKDGGEDRKPKQSSLSASNIRVQVEQLDKLMNLAGELVLARNQILQAATSSHDAAATGVAQRLNLITTELQERIMKVRMQAVGTMWNKLPRVVRDLSKQLGKSVHLEMQGKGTELDKTLLEAIQDPITHLVRNAVDHGIETPEERLAAGKEEVGTHRDRRRRPRHQRRGHQGQGSSPARHHFGASRGDERHPGLLVDLPPGTLDRQSRHQCLWPRGGHGCRSDQHRKGRRHRGRQELAGTRNHGTHPDSPDTGHHPGADHHRIGRPLRDPPGELGRAGQARR
jgi:two-component system chemotaxis sensor kinase CheA